jgi:hypothetical protein
MAGLDPAIRVLFGRVKGVDAWGIQREDGLRASARL